MSDVSQLGGRQQSVEFGVRVTKEPGTDFGPSSGYTIEVWHKHGDRKQPVDFAKVNAGDLWTALKMVVPYMAAAAQPDPFADLHANLEERTNA